MSVLQRRMFSNGGLARGSGMQRTYQEPVETTREFVYNVNGGVDFVEKDQDGNILQTIPVDLSLSETRNPAEALQRQRNVDKFNRLQTGLMALPFLKAPGAILKYGGKFIKPVLDKIPAFTTRAGPEVGKYGTQRVFSTTNPGQITGLTETGRNVALGGAGVGGYLGLEALKPGSVDFAGDIAELQKTDNTKNKGKPMGQSMGIEKKEDAKPEKTVIGLKEQPLVSKVISSPDFNRFLSNLSSSLTSTGSIAQGGAKAASDSLEEKLTSVDEVVGLKTSDAERNRNVNELLSNQLDSFNRTETNIAKIDYVLSILDDDATGFRGLLGQAFDAVNAFFGGDIDKEFAELSARERADKLLLALRQQDIRAILGESGRTISNLDREIVADIFGDITMFTPAPAIRRKLNDIRDQYADRLANNRNEITASVGYFKDAKMPSDVVQKNVDNILRISNMKNFRNYVPPKYDPDKDRNMISQSQGPITDVEYVEGT